MISDNRRIMRLEAETCQMERDAFKLLFEISKAITQELELDALLQRIMDRTREALRADRCSVFLLDAANEELWTVTAHGVNTKIRVPLDRGITGYVATTGELLNIPDAYADPRFYDGIDKATGYRTDTILAIPLKNNRGHVIGVFQVINKSIGHFTHDDEQMLEGVASIATIAIENSLLYGKREEKEDYTEHLSGLVAELARQRPLAVDGIFE